MEMVRLGFFGGTKTLSPPGIVSITMMLKNDVSTECVLTNTAAPNAINSTRRTSIPLTSRETPGGMASKAGRDKRVQATTSGTTGGRGAIITGTISDRIASRNIAPPTLPTPVKLNPLRTLLKGYEDFEFIVKGFEVGFSLGYDGNHSVLASNNSVSVNTNPKIVLEKVQCEISLGRIAGPYSDPPFDLFKCSPLALREKSCKGKYRLLHNLSYSYNHEAVNFNISDDHAKVSYAKLSDAFVLVRKFNNCFMAKSDIADAFRLIPLNPNDYNLTGFKIGGQFY